MFIHDAIEELIVCGDTSAQAGNLRIHVNGLHKIAPSKEETGFALQFKVRTYPINSSNKCTTVGQSLGTCLIQFVYQFRSV